MERSFAPSSTLASERLTHKETAASTRRTRWLYYLWQDKKAFVGLIILIILVFVAVFAPYITSYDPNAQDYDFLAKPSLTHLLGTDDLGRDLFTRMAYGARISLFVGITTVIISLVLGVLMGLVAGFYGGWIDNIIMRYIDVQWAFPNFIIAVYLVAVFGTGLSNVIVAITLAYLDDFARVTLGVVLSVREQEFVLAGRSIGDNNGRLLLRHILPATIAPNIVLATIFVSQAILAEAALSFLGLGVNPSTPTWGSILSNSRTFFSRAWWLATFPGLAIMITVLSINFLGDALRDILDVREYKEEVKN
jgi:peptide/nickel transport system permease protein